MRVWETCGALGIDRKQLRMMRRHRTYIHQLRHILHPASITLLPNPFKSPTLPPSPFNFPPPLSINHPFPHSTYSILHLGPTLAGSVTAGGRGSGGSGRGGHGFEGDSDKEQQFLLRYRRELFAHLVQLCGDYTLKLVVLTHILKIVSVLVYLLYSQCPSIFTI